MQVASVRHDFHARRIVLTHFPHDSYVINRRVRILLRSSVLYTRCNLTVKKERRTRRVLR